MFARRFETIEKNDSQWKNGNATEKANAAASSKAIRQKYLSKDDTLLDNGYVKVNYTEKYEVKNTSETSIGANVEISYTRLYTEKITYVSLTGVSISVNTDPGFVINNMSINNGQTDIKNNRTVDTYNTTSKTYKQNYNWKYVIDDGGPYTIVGTSVNIDISRGNKTKYNLLIFNQVHSKYHIYNGVIHNETNLWDMYEEAMQRGERQ